jgi:hypothetical protein
MVGMMRYFGDERWPVSYRMQIAAGQRHSGARVSDPPVARAVPRA